MYSKRNKDLQCLKEVEHDDIQEQFTLKNDSTDRTDKKVLGTKEAKVVLDRLQKCEHCSRILLTQESLDDHLHREECIEENEMLKLLLNNQKQNSSKTYSGTDMSLHGFEYEMFPIVTKVKSEPLDDCDNVQVKLEKDIKKESYIEDTSSMSFVIDMSSCGFEHEMLANASTIKTEPLDNIEKDVDLEVQIKVEHIKEEDVG